MNHDIAIERMKTRNSGYRILRRKQKVHSVDYSHTRPKIRASLETIYELYLIRAGKVELLQGIYKNLDHALEMGEQFYDSTL